MKFFYLKIILGILCGLLLTFLVSCGGDDDPVDETETCATLRAQAYDAMESELYKHLMQGAPDPEHPADVDFRTAWARYSDAFDCDGTNLEARFGLAVCDLLILSQDPDVIDAFDAWQDYLDLHTPFETDKSGGNPMLGLMAMPSNGAALNLPFDLVRNTALANVNALAAGEPQVAEVQRILKDVVLPRVEEALAMLGPVADSAGFQYMVSGRMQGDEYEIDREIDQTDVLALKAALRLLIAGIKVAVSIEVQFASYDDVGLMDGLDQDTGHIGTLVDGGIAWMQSVPASITAAADDLALAIDKLEAETDNQNNDVIKVGPQDIDQADLDEIRDDHIPDIKQAFSAGGITYTEDWDGDRATPDVPLHVDLHAFFNSPVEDFKDLLPAYTLTAEARYSWNFDEDIFCPVVHWAADTFAQWQDQMPDPTIQGLLPDLDTGAELCNTFGMDEGDWDPDMLWDWTGGGFDDVPPVFPLK